MNLLITAHTGCNDTPQNTIESLLKGAEWGADVCEVDVRGTGDEVPILWHDDFLETKGGEKLPIEKLSYHEISGLFKRREITHSSSYGEIIPLEEALQAAREKGILLNLDIKDDECIVPVAKLVKSRDLAEGVIFSGCGKVRASYLKSNYPEFQVLLNADEAFMERGDYSYERKVKGICDTAVSAGCCGINIRHSLYRKELQVHADQRFLPIAVWTVGPGDDFEKYIWAGVHSITTMHVKELVSLRSRLLRAT